MGGGIGVWRGSIGSIGGLCGDVGFHTALQTQVCLQVLDFNQLYELYNHITLQGHKLTGALPPTPQGLYPQLNPSGASDLDILLPRCQTLIRCTSCTIPAPLCSSTGTSTS